MGEKKGISEASEGVRRTTGEVSELRALGPRSRWSEKRKISVVLELLHGEDPVIISRRYGVTATLSGWRDSFLASGEAGSKAPEDEDREQRGPASENRRCRSALDNELLRGKVRQLESNRPLGWRRGSPEPHCFTLCEARIWGGSRAARMEAAAIKFL
jgi:transposase